MANKKTKKEYFTELYNFVDNSNISNKMEMLGFIEHEMDLLDKKASAKTQTKTQKENVGIKEIVCNALAEIGEGVTVTDLIKSTADLEGYTNQKISALLKQLVDDGKVVKNTDGKRTLFSLAD